MLLGEPSGGDTDAPLAADTDGDVEEPQVPKPD
jgi:hypothetical protein